ncbi:MAG: hypothetical protein H6561_13600 [Lewinellaceae bacterium]|nr:hypothetical protein [Lewinellaceae bacterium]
MDDTLKIGMAQIAPVWLNKHLTIAKIKDYITKAGNAQCEFWYSVKRSCPAILFGSLLTHGADFNAPMQKEIHAHYLRNAIQIESGDLDEICDLARKYQMAIYLGTIERAKNRGGHSLYCSLVYIDEKGQIKSVHRKLQPTYEERLAWSPGDGNGLQVHPLKSFTLGGLNCWENWMPLSRTALYGLGEDLHIAVWPGSENNTGRHHPLHRQRVPLLCGFRIWIYDQTRFSRGYASLKSNNRKCTCNPGKRGILYFRSGWELDRFTGHRPGRIDRRYD